DVWKPGEHNGTFRGHNPAFVTATAALETFWTDSRLSRSVDEKSITARTRLEKMAARCGGTVRGRGLILGLALENPALGARITRHAFEQGLIIETAGAEDQVVKLLPPLTIEPDELSDGLDRLDHAVTLAMEKAPKMPAR